MERCQNPTVISLGSIGNAPLQQKHVNKGQLLQFAWRFCRNVGTAMCDTAKLTAAQWKTEHPDISWTVHHNVNGRNPPNQLRLAVYPIIYRGLYIPGGNRRISEPSTVQPKTLLNSDNLGIVKSDEAVRHLHHVQADLGRSPLTSLKTYHDIPIWYPPTKKQKTQEYHAAFIFGDPIGIQTTGPQTTH